MLVREAAERCLVLVPRSNGAAPAGVAARNQRYELVQAPLFQNWHAVPISQIPSTRVDPALASPSFDITKSLWDKMYSKFIYLWPAGIYAARGIHDSHHHAFDATHRAPSVVSTNVHNYTMGKKPPD